MAEEEIFAKYERFLNPSIEWTVEDVYLLENLLETLDKKVPDSPTKKEAFIILNRFINEECSSERFPSVLQFAKKPETKCFVLSIIGGIIEKNWNSFKPSLRLGYRKLILNLILMTTELKELEDGDGKFLCISNNILLQILKFDYPEKWPTFLEDFVHMSKSPPLRSLNCLVILRIMSKEIFNNRLSWVKLHEIKESKNPVFTQIFLLCENLLIRCSDGKLLNYVLKTLLEYITWISPLFIFETHFVEKLIKKYDNVSNGCNILRLLIAIIHICPEKYYSYMNDIFLKFIEHQVKVFPPIDNYKYPFLDRNLIGFQENILLLTTFLTTTLHKQGEILRKINSHSFDHALNYLVSITATDEIDLVKPCLNYFIILLPKLRSEKIQMGTSNHRQPLKRLCYYIVSKITRPQKRNDYGRVIRAHHDADSIQIFRNMDLILGFLIYLNPFDVLFIIEAKLVNFVKGPGFSEKSLISLCTAVGVINEKVIPLQNLPFNKLDIKERMFWILLKNLLELSSKFKERKKKITIATCIMYMLSDYASYLNSSWKLLKMSISKIFTFMHAREYPTKTLAFETFIRIAQKCKSSLIIVQPGEHLSGFRTALNEIDNLLNVMEYEQVPLFYEALGNLAVANAPEVPFKTLKERIGACMALPNEDWKRIVMQSKKSDNIFLQYQFILDILFILRINKAACRGMGYYYQLQLSVISRNMMDIYRRLTDKIYSEVSKKGTNAIRERPIVYIRFVKKEILQIVITWINQIGFKTGISWYRWFLNSFSPVLLPSVMMDYQFWQSRSNMRQLCEPEVLILLKVIIRKNLLTEYTINCFSEDIRSTGCMINQNNDLNPHFIKSFFSVLRELMTKYFQEYIRSFSINRIISAIFHCMTHKTDEIANGGINLLLMLLKMVQSSNAHEEFYKLYYPCIFRNAIGMATSRKKIDFKSRAKIVSILLELVAEGRLKICIDRTRQMHNMPIPVYIQFYIKQVLQKKYQISKMSHLQFLMYGFFKYYKDVSLFAQFLKNLPALTLELRKEELRMKTVTAKEKK